VLSRRIISFSKRYFQAESSQKSIIEVSKMKRITKLTRQEKAIEDALMAGEFVDISQEEQEQISQAIAGRKKDAVLNVRINSQDLKNIKQKAKKLGIKYQTFISEILHKVAI
jgi:predicted DNA binding CopG/RHH family protein